MAEPTLILDIGTTTISGALLERTKGAILASGSVLNKQIDFGDDLITRIERVAKRKVERGALHKAAALSVNKLLTGLTSASGIKNKDIKEAFCVSNTAIHHLFLGIDPSSLIIPPYRAAQRAGVTIYSDRTSLKLKKDTPITFLPNIGGFVGSDALAVIISSGIYRSKCLKLAIDIGTNGEVMLGNRERIFVASTAAGPAFEGRHISCGMPAKRGAIEKISLKKAGLGLKVIGGSSPEGICGSGFINGLAQMLRQGIIDASGRMKGAEFILYKRGGRKISITQQDVRKAQLAKAAIYAAVKVLIRKRGVCESEIKEVLITGSFGNTIDPRSVAAVGLIPDVGLKRVSFLPGGALEGLRLYLSKPSIARMLPSILSKTRHMPLFGKGFAEQFTSSLFLGHSSDM